MRCEFNSDNTVRIAALVRTNFRQRSVVGGCFKRIYDQEGLIETGRNKCTLVQILYNITSYVGTN